MNDPNDEAETAVRPSRLAVAGVVCTVVLAIGWFVVSWIVWNSPVVDALGESMGGVALVLVVVSVIGSFANSR